MPCLTPITLVRKKPKFDGSITDIVPCGRCPQCLIRRQNDWCFRLQEEQKISISSSFITLTYEEDNLPFSENGLMSLKVRDHQLFIKKLRYKVKTKIKYFACGEYGAINGRPHFHLIIFGYTPKDLQELKKGLYNSNEVAKM